MSLIAPILIIAVFGMAILGISYEEDNKTVFAYYNGETDITEQVAVGYEFDNRIELVLKNTAVISAKSIDFGILCMSETRPLINYSLVLRQVGCEDKVLFEKSEQYIDIELKCNEVIEVALTTAFAKVDNTLESVTTYKGAYLLLVIETENTKLTVVNLNIK